MLHFGIIGAGNIAHKFIEAVRMTTEADVTAVASKSMERAKAWAKKESLSLYYDSYEKLLADPDIDVVYIATLSNAHYDNIKACLGGQACYLRKANDADRRTGPGGH